MTSNNEVCVMSEARALEIALVLMKYLAGQKEFTINRQDQDLGDGLSFATRIGIPATELRTYAFMVTAPAAIKAGEGDDIEIVFKGEKLPEQRLREIAFAFIKERAMGWAPRDLLKKVRPAQVATGIPENEIRAFYALHLLPHVMGEVGKFRHISVKASNEPPSRQN